LARGYCIQLKLKAEDFCLHTFLSNLMVIISKSSEEQILIGLLLSLLPWKLVSYDSSDGLEISFLEGTLLLRVKFGATLEGCLFADRPARLVTDLTLTSQIKGAFCLVFTAY